jgi:hypothetical protein
MHVPVLRLPRAEQEPQDRRHCTAHAATPAPALGEGGEEFMAKPTELTIARGDIAPRFAMQKISAC